MTSATQHLPALISETEYAASHAELRQHLAMAPEQRDDARVRALGLVIDDYERAHFPVEPPSLVDAVLARMSDFDYSVADLAHLTRAQPRQIEQLLQGESMVPRAMVLTVADVLGLPAEAIRGAGRAGGETAGPSAASSGVKLMNRLLLDELRDIYHAEKQLVKALPKMAKRAKSDKLRQAFEHHLEETKGQVDRLERVFDKLNARPRGKRCEAMEGLIEEAQEMMEEITTPEVLDAALIAAGQKLEHYEIASYGSARALAEGLAHKEVAQLLEETLNEEKEADQKLNKIALSEVNKSALKAVA